MRAAVGGPRPRPLSGCPRRARRGLRPLRGLRAIAQPCAPAPLPAAAPPALRGLRAARPRPAPSAALRAVARSCGAVAASGGGGCAPVPPVGSPSASRPPLSCSRLRAGPPLGCARVSAGFPRRLAGLVAPLRARGRAPAPAGPPLLVALCAPARWGWLRRPRRWRWWSRPRRRAALRPSLQRGQENKGRHKPIIYPSGVYLTR